MMIHFRSTVGAVCVFAFFVSSVAAQAQVFEGNVDHITDGDTFAMSSPVERHKIRLCGVDSPEAMKPGYQAAKNALHGLIYGRSVRCVVVGGGTPCDGKSRKKSRGRFVSQCFLGSKDIAAEMIQLGHACDWSRHSGGYYRMLPTTCVSPRL